MKQALCTWKDAEFNSGLDIENIILEGDFLIYYMRCEGNDSLGVGMGNWLIMRRQCVKYVIVVCEVSQKGSKYGSSLSSEGVNLVIIGMKDYPTFYS